MSADVIEQLRMLGDLLDAHTAPVTLNDIRRTELHEELEPGSVIDTHVPMTRRPMSARGSRRIAVAALAVAAMLLGLVLISRRDTGDVVPGEKALASDAGPPAWYDLIAPSLPERFPYLALTFATDAQLFFVAFSPNDGKTLVRAGELPGAHVSPVPRSRVPCDHSRFDAVRRREVRAVRSAGSVRACFVFDCSTRGFSARGCSVCGLSPRGVPGCGGTISRPGGSRKV